MTYIVHYSIIVFIVVFLSGCVLNLLRKHFIFQLTGIAFFCTYTVFKMIFSLQVDQSLTAFDIYSLFLPTMTGVSACLISMVLGFWIFPPIRKKFKD